MKTIRIKVPSHNECLKAVKMLYLISSLKSSVGYFILAITLAALWHLFFPNALTGNSIFNLSGFIVFGLFVQSVFVIAMYFIDAHSLNNKSDEFVRRMYVELVKTGDIKPAISKK